MAAMARTTPRRRARPARRGARFVAIGLAGAGALLAALTAAFASLPRWSGQRRTSPPAALRHRPQALGLRSGSTTLVRALNLPERAGSSTSKQAPGDEAVLADGASAEGAANPNVARLQLPMSQYLGLAYTCGPCGARNAISVNRIAWNDGVVVATCRGCKARHLLADNGGLLDLDNDTGFTNVIQFIESKGDKVLRMDRADAEALDQLGLAIGADGKLKLSNATASAEDATLAAAAAAAAAAAPEAVAAAAAKAEAVADAKAAAAIAALAEEDVDSAPIVLRLPEGVMEGDVLNVQSDFGTLHVQVPRGAPGGCRLEVLGMVEVRPGNGVERWVQSSGEGEWEKSDAWKVGDIVAVPLPEGVVARIRILESEASDFTLRIAHPVAILRD